MIDDYKTILQRASQSLASGDLASADRHCRHALVLNHNSVPALVLQGSIRTRQGQWQGAEESLTRANKLAPNEPEIPFVMGMLRVRQGRHDEAITLFKKSQRMRPEHLGVRMAMSDCLRRMGQPDEALRALGTPTIPELHLAAGQAHLDLGNLDDAERHLRAGLEMGGGGASSRVQLPHLLGQVLEQRGDYSGAFAAYSASRAVIPVQHDVAAAKTLGARLRETFVAELFEKFANLPIPSKRPVFIAGMPRTGTTLIEKMIASHPQGAGAGETNALRLQIEQLPQSQLPHERWPGVVATFTPERFASIARSYLGATDVYAGGSIERVADKYLANWFYVGLIAIAFPQASIIHIRRDPMDTGLSCFQRLLPNAMPWCTDLTHIGFMLALNERLMDHWHHVLPGRMIEVQYEEFAKSPATVLPPIIEKIGLPWNDACLRHHERVHRPSGHEPPPTLSEDQVRKPVYDSSIGRAERFGAALDPLRQAYQKARDELFS